MTKSSKLLIKLSQRLFSDVPTQEKFIDALIHPHSFHPCILWTKEKPADHPFTTQAPIAWQPEWVDRLAIASQPGKHQLHQQGYFYCLDFSSIFAASTLLMLDQSVDIIIDMCAAPGGKTVFAWRALKPQIILSNEVIGKRKGALISNLKRCDLKAAIALSRDSKILAEEIPNTADVVIVDAPCTGQSLIAKGDDAPGCFHPVSINKNANRQKRILANSAQVVASQGHLAYMTCAYSPEENEQVSEWFLQRFPHFQPVSIPHLVDYQSHLTQMPCYRMFPPDGLGAGAFTILFQNVAEGDRQPLPPDFLSRIYPDSQNL
jgi:16S rRNA C967 or C1407 C5-methylase (RsmB/RsmF family)